MLNEHRRRHGMRERVQGDEGGTVEMLASEARRQLLGKRTKEGGDGQGEVRPSGRGEEEERLRALRGTMVKREEREGGT